MANRAVLLCLLILCLSLYVSECKRGFGGFGGSRSSSRGSSSWGKSWGGGSSYKPSSSSSGWFGSSGSSYKPSSSSSGSSWLSSYKPSSSYNTGSSLSGSGYKPSSSSSGSSWWSSGSSGSSYPSSSSGLSGTGRGSHSYPSSSTGLSGSGSGSHGYPSSSSGLSGSGSRTHNYPSSSTGLSGSGSGSHGYPSSSTGLSGSSSGSNYPSSVGKGSHSYPSSSSGSGSGSKYPSSGSGSHSYPSGTGLSGSGGSSYRPSHSYNTNSGYGSGYNSASYVPTYYHYPQHVYVTQYRDSGSRYSDLLTGLTLYNLGRSHGHHYNDHYYYDDYYRHRYSSSSSSAYGNDNQPKGEATCTLRVKENGRVELLKIPCEIVSTFTEDSKIVKNPSETRINTTVCTTNTTVIKRIKPVDVAVNTTLSPNVPAVSIVPTTAPSANETTTKAINISVYNMTSEVVTNKVNETNLNAKTPTTNMSESTVNPVTSTVTPVTVTSTENPTLNVTTNGTTPVSTTSTSIPLSDQNGKNITVKPITIVQNSTEGNKTKSIVRVITTTEEIVNVTICTTESKLTDPLNVKKGGAINPKAMECSVDIKTRDTYLRHNVDCETLMKYSKTSPPPNKPSSVLPEKQTLKTWLTKPPWWLSMFIAV